MTNNVSFRHHWKKTGPLQPSLLDPDLKRACVLPVFTTRGFSAATSQRPICMVTFLWSRDGIAVVSNNIHPTHIQAYTFSVYSIKGQAWTTLSWDLWTTIHPSHFFHWKRKDFWKRKGEYEPSHGSFSSLVFSPKLKALPASVSPSLSTASRSTSFFPSACSKNLYLNVSNQTLLKIGASKCFGV